MKTNCNGSVTSIMYNKRKRKGLDSLGKRRTKHVCQECGYESARWMGRCPGCNQFNTLVEEIFYATKHTSMKTSGLRKENKAERITTIEAAKEPRVKAGMKEFDRVLGGGIVPGSLVLIGGDPGIGKSTLLLQIAALVAKQETPVLYVSSEEL